MPRGERGGPEESHTGHAGQVRGPRRLGWALVRNIYGSFVSDSAYITYHFAGSYQLPADPDLRRSLLNHRLWYHKMRRFFIFHLDEVTKV